MQAPGTDLGYDNQRRADGIAAYFRSNGVVGVGTRRSNTRNTMPKRSRMSREGKEHRDPNRERV
jgi:hypothetical protein